MGRNNGCENQNELMKKSVILLAAGMASASLYALPDYEPFADATGNGGPSYAVGANLIGQTDALGQTWYIASPTSATQPKIVAGNLSYTGLPTSQGNSVSFGGSGESARLNLSSVVGSGTLYYSCIINISSAPSGGSGGIFFAGFNNSLGSQSTTPTTVATRIYGKGFGSTFQLGTSKSSSTASDWVFDSTVRNVGDTVFVVGAYTFNTATTSDDVATMWINPNPSDLGAATAPAYTLQTSSGGDITLGQIASFLLMDRNANELGGTMDELRIGTSWADVTAVPEPATGLVACLGVLALLWRYRASDR